MIDYHGIGMLTKLPKKVKSGIGAIRKICDFADLETQISVYNALIKN